MTREEKGRKGDTPAPRVVTATGGDKSGVEGATSPVKAEGREIKAVSTLK